MKDRDRLVRLLVSGLERRGVMADPRYKDRLKKELKEIDAQAKHEYYVELYDKFQAENLVFPKNEHNNLVDYALGLADEFDIESPSAFNQGESPDIDIDYLRPVRDYLKRDWAPKRFGRDSVCEIGTYGTSGIKGALLDIARVYSKDHNEIQAITKGIQDKIQDDDGETHEMEWWRIFEIASFAISPKKHADALRLELERRVKNKETIDYEEIYHEQKARVLESEGRINTDSPYVQLAEYCERNPEVASAAKTVLERNRSGGVHAGGLVVSSVPLSSFVPLEVRLVNKENPSGIICTAWTEGLNRQDLGPVGLIKFDLLVINNLMQIALATHLIKERHGLERICALPGKWDWSDLSYLNDPKALEMANRADLKCIFQFDGEGIQKLVKRGGVTSFDDLAAYSALYRPGPLNMGMDVKYCRRKKWALNHDDPDGEPFNIHPVMEKSLGVTYGILAYQEQVMDILRLVGLIPDMLTEKVRKAISKKKIAEFTPYKTMFMENGQKTLGVNKEFVEDLWAQIESFAEYGFNRSHAYAYTYISSRLLWLKAHYPLEFYTAVLMCESDTDKFREYKLDAKYHGINVCPVNINKSKANFHIEDNSIYFGFANIKGIGEAIANKIVEGQPYTNFEDFLQRFGTEAAVLKPLVALKVFDEPQDRITLRKYSEFYKKQSAGRKARQTRYLASLDQKAKEMREMLLTEISENDPDFERLCEFTEAGRELRESRFEGVMRGVPQTLRGVERIKSVKFSKLLNAIADKRDSSVRNFEMKEREDDVDPITLSTFNGQNIKLDPKEEELLSDYLVVNGERSYPEAERLYYGFQWTHVLESCDDYKGETIDAFLDQAENQGLSEGPIEVLIKNVVKRKSKKDVVFYSIDIEDANSKTMKVNVWQDDYERFKEEFVAGALLRIRVRPPSGGFNTLTFVSYPKHKKKFMPSKDLDERVVVLRSPVSAPEQSAQEFTFDENAITGLEGI